MRKLYCNQVILALAVVGLTSVSHVRAYGDDFRPFGGFFADLLGDETPVQKPVHSQQARPQPSRQQPTPAAQQQTAQEQSTPTDNGDQYFPQQRPVVRHTIAHNPTAEAVAPAQSLVPGIAVVSPTVSPSIGPNSATGKNLTFQFDDGTSNNDSAPQSSGRSTATVQKDYSPSTSGAAVAGGGSSLNDMLQNSQQSQFGPVSPSTNDTNQSPPSASASNNSPTPGVATPTDAGSPGQTQVGQAQVGQSPVQTNQAQSSTPATLPSAPANDTPTSAAPSSGGLISDLTRSQEPATKSDHSTLTTPNDEPKKVAKSEAGPQLLSARKSPILTTETIGPQRISVGKEANYDVILQNSGEVAAEEVTVSVLLPEWADIASTTPSSGRIHVSAGAQHEPCQWLVGRVEAKSRERLSLRIIPRASKPFELAVRFDFKAAPAQAMIEVQEPRLAMKLDGPREVLFGKHEVFKLKLSNQGNGPAENVVLRLMPLAGGDPQPVSHKLGTLAAGEERSIEIELTARQAGNLMIHVDAMADATAQAELAEKIVVRRAELKIETDGPVVQYLGTPATYKIHVRNSGDALAKSVKLAVKLPAGVRYLSGSDGATVSSADDGTKVQWTLDQVAAGGERELLVKCTLALSGANRIEIGATGDDEVAAAGEMTTRAEALADLRMDVKDPEGPVPVGQEATYELRIRNRGTKAADGVEVFAFFSSGIEPVAGEGHPHRVSSGQVVFAPLPVLPPNTEVTLRVRAKATSAGNHVFRAEIHCRESGTRLVREETTHFYQEGLAVAQPGSPGQQVTAPQATAPQASAPQSPAPLASTQDAGSKADPHANTRTADRPAVLPEQSASPLPGAGSANRAPGGTRF